MNEQIPSFLTSLSSRANFFLSEVLLPVLYFSTLYFCIVLKVETTVLGIAWMAAITYFFSVLPSPQPSLVHLDSKVKTH